MLKQRFDIVPGERIGRLRLGDPSAPILAEPGWTLVREDVSEQGVGSRR